MKPRDSIAVAFEHADAAARTLNGAILDNPARQSRAAITATAELKAALAELEKVKS